jgi:alpha-N-arabinofuranosidase
LNDTVPAVSGTAARGTDGKLYVSLANLHPDETAEVPLAIEGAVPGAATAEILTGARMDAHNTFAAPDAVRPAPFADFTVQGGVLRVELPAKSIVMIAAE